MNKSETIREWALSKVGCPYIFASNGQKCTPAYRERQEVNKPAYAANIKKYCPVRNRKQSTCDGCKYKDKQSFDCSGLTKEAAKLIGLALPHGASSQWKGDYWDEKGPIAQMPLEKVCFVYNDMPDADPMGHVGIYLGNGYVVDARSHAKGVLYDALGSYAWSHYGLLKGMMYETVDASDTPVTEKHDTLRKGITGPLVAEMQSRLLAHGMQLPKWGADGIFGDETEKAVKDFQTLRGLEVDGICGDLTLAALYSGPWPDPSPMDTYTFVVPNMTAAQAMAEQARLLAAYGACEMAVG